MARYTCLDCKERVRRTYDGEWVSGDHPGQALCPQTGETHRRKLIRRTEADRNHERYELLRARIIDCWGQAKRYQTTHTQLLDRLQSVVWLTPEYNHLGEAHKFGLREVSRGCSDLTYQSVEWVLGDANGPIPEGRGRHDWTTGRLSQLSQDKALYGAHFWTGSDKLWGEWKAL